MHLSNKHQGTGINKVYYSQVLVGTEPHSKVTGRERQRSMHLGLCLYWGLRVGA